MGGTVDHLVLRVQAKAHCLWDRRSSKLHLHFEEEEETLSLQATGMWFWEVHCIKDRNQTLPAEGQEIASSLGSCFDTKQTGATQGEGQTALFTQN